MGDKRDKTCCFTGHRKIALGDIPAVRRKLKKTLIQCIKRGYLYFGAGGALGFDTIAAQTVLELKKKYPEIKLILVLPCKTQTRGWKEKDVAEYERIMEKADKVKYTSENYSLDCFFRRNRHLVDFSSLCICYLTKNNGGTLYTVNYAEKRGLEIINLAQS